MKLIWNDDVTGGIQQVCGHTVRLSWINIFTKIIFANSTFVDQSRYLIRPTTNKKTAGAKTGILRWKEGIWSDCSRVLFHPGDYQSWWTAATPLPQFGTTRQSERPSINQSGDRLLTHPRRTRVSLQGAGTSTESVLFVLITWQPGIMMVYSQPQCLCIRFTLKG